MHNNVIMDVQLKLIYALDPQCRHISRILFVNDFRLGIGYEIVHFTTYVNYWMIAFFKY